MKKVVVNITTYIGNGGMAEHYYARVLEVNTNKSIYDVENFPTTSYGDNLQRTITDVKEARQLNYKDKTKIWRVGRKTERFGSIQQIKNFVDEKYNKQDIAFLYFNELLSEDRDIIERNPEVPNKTGRKIKIQGFEGFNPKEFKNLTEGSIHEVLKTPKRYIGKETMEGVWVWGITEPVKVLTHEYLSV